jgi:hypothetical protein
MGAMSTGSRRSGRALRPARAVLVAVAGVGVGLLGHAAGGGALDEVLVLVAPALLVGIAAGLVVSRLTWTVPRVAAALLAQQALAHSLSWITSPSASAHPRLGALAEPHAGMLHDHAGLTPRMVAAHLVAAAAFAVALVPAERAVSLLGAWLRRIVVVLGPAVAARVPVAPLPSPGRLPVPQLVHLCLMRGNAPPGAVCSG